MPLRLRCRPPLSDFIPASMTLVDNSSSPLIMRSVHRFLQERLPCAPTQRGEVPVRTRSPPRPSFIASAQSHPAFALARPDPEFMAELTALPLYCLASRVSMQRWEVKFRSSAPSPAPPQQWNVFRICVGLQQRRALLTRGGLCELLVLRLTCFRGEYRVRRPLHAAACILSQRHFLVSRDRAERLYREGQQLHAQQRYGDAARSWAQAALLQHAPSHAYLSNMLIEGRHDVMMDDTMALKVAQAGAAQGCPHSNGVLARCYCMMWDKAPGNAAKGRALAEHSAAAGSCFGQIVLGNCYYTAKDDAEAVRLYRLAADQGFAAAQKNLGVMFASGRGVQKDNVEAVRLYRLAAAQGHVQAHWHLGGSLYVGQGAPRDKAEGIRLMRIAALHGCHEAIAKLKRIESKTNAGVKSECDF